jgi:hypothetical protein
MLKHFLLQVVLLEDLLIIILALLVVGFWYRKSGCIMHSTCYKHFPQKVVPSNRRVEENFCKWTKNFVICFGQTKNRKRNYNKGAQTPPHQ